MQTSFMISPDGLSQAMVQAILRFESEGKRLSLHISTERGLIRRGLVEEEIEGKRRPEGVYPTQAGMVVAGVVHALWHTVRALIDAKVPLKAQKHALEVLQGNLPIEWLVKSEEFEPGSPGSARDVLEAVIEARHPTVGRPAWEPPYDWDKALEAL